MRRRRRSLRNAVAAGSVDTPSLAELPRGAVEVPQVGGLFLGSVVLCREDKVGYLLGGVGVEGGCDVL